ncbi:16S rRNA (cytidine(1402)-2'-O)-methyltransferase [Salinispora tropica]|uniref:Ribosomal RNA small subunit methyltransferase I n=1 Tax=Salinispora tropica (strain ATCC BAA-916 / DSM 44818 / JCM 13857 / NBRC 105044 / CNB-440) TaxID=369723 RepID=A4X306_SALTO|nr:16S rRNA (cytidine(1402)-2'-O)-methyltransferase [Salinispora tropica]ABP53256.1 Uroporphyrin-III C/tetrapyrrole (Corrin/Porphyrin) methyltransferase [Salinispora tropica CNB-440]
MDAKSDVGHLVLLGAPLGNPADASARLREVLATADLVAAEDTRRLARLARELEVTVTGRIVSYFEGNEERRTPELVEALRAGLGVALITDGGMPSVSDPGYRLVRAALDAGIPVTAAPGPSAVTTALTLSGLASDRFCFEGFLPRSPGARRARLTALATEERTLVFFEAPHRVAASLADLATAFGAHRPAALCRELTKTYEQVLRRPLGELASWAAEKPARGEITLVVAGATGPARQRPDDETLRSAVTVREEAGRSRRDAVTEVAVEYGLRRREVYDIVHR